MKWNRLKKGSDDIYRLNPNDDLRLSSKSLSESFSQLGFDNAEEERLITTDTRGYVYLFEFRGYDDITYKKFEKFTAPTCLAFNPHVKSEILLALTTNDVIICKPDLKNRFILSAKLTSHRFPVTQISFFKNYCLTASSKEAIIWDLSTCAKIRQLRLQLTSENLKKATFSNCGHVAVLYSNDALQIWSYNDFNEESRLLLRDFGLRLVKDFVFTRDGRAIVICAAKGGIRILDNASFDLIASFEIAQSRSIPKRICLIPNPFDARSAKILAIHRADGRIEFFDLSEGKFVNAKKGIWRGIRNFAISAQGRWIACVDVNGSLNVFRIDKLHFSNKQSVEKKSKDIGSCVKAHRTKEHLRSVKNDMDEELRLCRLLPILEEFGEYPEKHRIVIWSTLMELPANRDACAGLNENTSLNALIREMLSEYPLKDQLKASLLATTTDKLVRWCSLLGQCKFLPALVFPFLMVFQKNRLMALEASITVLSNYCQKWFEYYPLPPLNVLGILENILLESDPALLSYFCERGITSTDYAWHILQTTLSEVLSANEWLILWDHILSYRRPSFLLMCVIAYNICCRETIMSLLRKPDDFRRFYSTQGNISVKKLIKVAQRIDQNTPERIHPDRYLRTSFVVLPKKGPYPPFLMHEYPKFLIEEQSELAKLGALKEEEKILQEYHRQAMKIADEKRLRDEIDNFVKDVDRKRMIELRKCYDRQLRMARFNVENTRDEIQRYASTYGETTSRSMEDIEDVNSGTKSTPISRNLRRRSNNYNELRNQVQHLEFQVQQFLSALHTRSSDNAL